MDTEHEFVSCGYPYGQREIVCPKFVMDHVVQGFKFSGKSPSMIFPGMSGGPVIDITSGQAIAVNYASVPKSDADMEAVPTVSPLIGFLGAFHIEPPVQ